MGGKGLLTRYRALALKQVFLGCGLVGKGGGGGESVMSVT